MSKENPYQNGLKRIKAATLKVDTLKKSRLPAKQAESLKRHKFIMHFGTSFATQLLLEGKYPPQYHQLLNAATSSFRALMTHAESEIDSGSKKQLTYLMLLAHSFQLQGKFKMALQILFQAQKVTSQSLDQSNPRHLDYTLAVNVMTAVVLLKVARFEQALEFIGIAERVLASLIEYNIFDKVHPRITEYEKRRQEIEKEFVEKLKEEQFLNSQGTVSGMVHMRQFGVLGGAERVATTRGGARVNHGGDLVDNMRGPISIELFGGPAGQGSNDGQNPASPMDNNPPQVHTRPSDRAIFSQQTDQRGGKHDSILDGGKELQDGGTPWQGAWPPQLAAATNNSNGESAFTLTREQIKKQQKYVKEKLGPPPVVKPSRLTITLLQNYLLATSLLKQTCLKETKTSSQIDVIVGKQLEMLRDVEFKIMERRLAAPLPPRMSARKRGLSAHARRMDPVDEGRDISISFLVVSHKRELLDQSCDPRMIVKQTLNEHFLSMLASTYFGPFMHPEAPKSGSFPSKKSTIDEQIDFLPDEGEICLVIEKHRRVTDAVEYAQELDRQEEEKRREQHRQVQQAIDKMKVLRQDQHEIESFEQRMRASQRTDSQGPPEGSFADQVDQSSIEHAECNVTNNGERSSVEQKQQQFFELPAAVVQVGEDSASMSAAGQPVFQTTNIVLPQLVRDVPLIARESFDRKSKEQMSALMREQVVESVGDGSVGGAVNMDTGAPLSGSGQPPSEKVVTILSEPNRRGRDAGAKPRSIIKPFSPPENDRAPGSAAVPSLSLASQGGPRRVQIAADAERKSFQTRDEARMQTYGILTSPKAVAEAQVRIRTSPMAARPTTIEKELKDLLEGSEAGDKETLDMILELKQKNADEQRRVRKQIKAILRQGTESERVSVSSKPEAALSNLVPSSHSPTRNLHEIAERDENGSNTQLLQSRVKPNKSRGREQPSSTTRPVVPTLNLRKLSKGDSGADWQPQRYGDEVQGSARPKGQSSSRRKISKPENKLGEGMAKLMMTTYNAEMKRTPRHRTLISQRDRESRATRLLRADSAGSSRSGGFTARSNRSGMRMSKSRLARSIHQSARGGEDEASSCRRAVLDQRRSRAQAELNASRTNFNCAIIQESEASGKKVIVNPARLQAAPMVMPDRMSAIKLNFDSRGPSKQMLPMTSRSLLSERKNSPTTRAVLEVNQKHTGPVGVTEPSLAALREWQPREKPRERRDVHQRTATIEPERNERSLAKPRQDFDVKGQQHQKRGESMPARPLLSKRQNSGTQADRPQHQILTERSNEDASPTYKQSRPLSGCTDKKTGQQVLQQINKVYGEPVPRRPAHQQAATQVRETSQIKKEKRNKDIQAVVELKQQITPPPPEEPIFQIQQPGRATDIFETSNRNSRSSLCCSDNPSLQIEKEKQMKIKVKAMKDASTEPLPTPMAGAKSFPQKKTKQHTIKTEARRPNHTAAMETLTASQDDEAPSPNTGVGAQTFKKRPHFGLQAGPFDMAKHMDNIHRQKQKVNRKHERERSALRGSPKLVGAGACSPGRLRGTSNESHGSRRGEATDEIARVRVQPKRFTRPSKVNIQMTSAADMCKSAEQPSMVRRVGTDGSDEESSRSSARRDGDTSRRDEPQRGPFALQKGGRTYLNQQSCDTSMLAHERDQQHGGHMYEDTNGNRPHAILEQSSTNLMINKTSHRDVHAPVTQNPPRTSTKFESQQSESVIPFASRTIGHQPSLHQKLTQSNTLVMREKRAGHPSSQETSKTAIKSRSHLTSAKITPTASQIKATAAAEQTFSFEGAQSRENIPASNSATPAPAPASAVKAKFSVPPSAQKGKSLSPPDFTSKGKFQPAKQPSKMLTTMSSTQPTPLDISQMVSKAAAGRKELESLQQKTHASTLKFAGMQSNVRAQYVTSPSSGMALPGVSAPSSVYSRFGSGSLGERSASKPVKKPQLPKRLEALEDAMKHAYKYSQRHQIFKQNEFSKKSPIAMFLAEPILKQQNRMGRGNYGTSGATLDEINESALEENARLTPLAADSLAENSFLNGTLQTPLELSDTRSRNANGDLKLVHSRIEMKQLSPAGGPSLRDWHRNRDLYNESQKVIPATTKNQITAGLTTGGPRGVSAVHRKPNFSFAVAQPTSNQTIIKEAERRLEDEQRKINVDSSLFTANELDRFESQKGIGKKRNFENFYQNEATAAAKDSRQVGRNGAQQRKHRSKH